MHIHFVGIFGSGISGVACVAKSLGYEVSGCDSFATSNYAFQIKQAGIETHIGHDRKHLDGVDVVAISPAFLYNESYKHIEELRLASNKGILMKWQEFLGKYVFKDNETIGVCGTHGKTTTTSILGLAMEQAGVDPTVFVGGVVPKWNHTYRCGSDKYYVIEADEYDSNFIYYNPKYVILTSLEMEHPEIFASFDEYKKVFIGFLKTIREGGKIVFNADDEGVVDVMHKLKHHFRAHDIEMVGYGMKASSFEGGRFFSASGIKPGLTTSFEIEGKKINSNLLGMHNVYNVLSVYAMCASLGIDVDFNEVMKNFGGAKRRMELILENDVVRLFNDYAHHHTQVKANILALKGVFKEPTIAILEPHQISRLKDNADEYMAALNCADYFYITKIYDGREAGKERPDVGAMIKPYSTKSKHIVEKNRLVEDLLIHIKTLGGKANVVVMGAGNSYQLAEMLKEKLS